MKCRSKSDFSSKHVDFKGATICNSWATPKGLLYIFFAKFLYVQMCILIFVEFKNKATSRLLIYNESLWLMYFSIDTTYFQTHPIDK